MEKIVLKPSKDVPIRAGHPWIFSEAIAKDTTGEPGILVEVHSSKNEFLGIGTWNGNTSIRVRLLTHERKNIDTAFFTKRLKQLDDWKRSHLPSSTNGYRVVHAEADGIPGLIVDRYDETIVFQLHTAGMDRLRTEIIQAIKEALRPAAVIERSDIEVRKQEGLSDQPITVHAGVIDKPVPFQENGLTFLADVLHGQKTGFFLDQREARLAVGQLAKDKRVLNLFGYSGAFSVHAMKGGAQLVTTVDVSRSALELAQKNFTANGFDPEDESTTLFLEADVLDLLRDEKIPQAPYDLIVCDPPAFAKTSRHVPQAIKAYTDINASCLKQLQPGGILVTSSCSGRLTPEEFRSLLRIAAGRAGRDVRIIDWIGHPIDHAERLSFPEGRYLKTALLEVTGIL